MEHTSSEHGTHHSHKNDNRMLLGILAYLGPLVIISYVMGRDDHFVKFHVKQGLVLLVINLILWILGPSLWSLGMVVRVINLGLLVLAILGIVNVVQNKEDKLPLVGQFAKYFNF